MIFFETDADSMKYRQEQLLSNFTAELDALRRERDDRNNGKEAVGRSQRAAGQLTLVDIQQKMDAIEHKRTYQIEHYNSQKTRRSARMKRSVS